MFATFPLGHAPRQARALLTACVIHGLGIGAAVLLVDTRLRPAREAGPIVDIVLPAPEAGVRRGLASGEAPVEVAPTVPPLPAPVGLDAIPSIVPLETGSWRINSPGALDSLVDTGEGSGGGADFRAVRILPDEPAELILPPVLDYPRELRRAGIAGVVLLEFVVDTAGMVELAGVRVIESSHPAFTSAVIGVLPAARFRPGRMGGQPVRQLVRQSFRFVL